MGCERIGWTKAGRRRRQWAATTAVALEVSGLRARGRTAGLRSLSLGRGGGDDGGQGNGRLRARATRWRLQGPTARLMVVQGSETLGAEGTGAQGK